MVPRVCTRSLEVDQRRRRATAVDGRNARALRLQWERYLTPHFAAERGWRHMTPTPVTRPLNRQTFTSKLTAGQSDCLKSLSSSLTLYLSVCVCLFVCLFVSVCLSDTASWLTYECLSLGLLDSFVTVLLMFMISHVYLVFTNRD